MNDAMKISLRTRQAINGKHLEMTWCSLPINGESERTFDVPGRQVVGGPMNYPLLVPQDPVDKRLTTTNLTIPCLLLMHCYYLFTYKMCRHFVACD